MKKIARFAFVTALMALVSSCSFFPMLTPLFGGDGASSLKFSMDGAKAIAATNGTSRSARGMAMGREVSTDGVLVKILEDGTTQSLIDFGAEDSWRPNVAFISVGDDGSAYICFEQPYTTFENNTSTTIQFVRVYKDSHYDVLWPTDPTKEFNWSTDGRVCTWSWWGMDSDPLAKGPGGKLYFKVSSGGMSTDDSIYQYDPDTAQAPTRVTPEGAGLSIGTFMVDAKSHLFIQSAPNYGGSTSSFMRYYKPNVVAPTTVYYSSSNNVWVRGYITSPSGDYAILNGCGIRGLNGIIKVSSLDSTPAYELMYGNVNGGSWINLTYYYSWSGEYDTTIIRQTSEGINPTPYAWVDQVKTGSTLDTTKLLSRVSRYFVQDGTSLSLKSGVVAQIATSSDGLTKTDLQATDLLALGNLTASNDYVSQVGTITFDHTTFDGNGIATTSPMTARSLGEYINAYGEDFLRNTFSKKLFKDWLNEPAQATLRSLNFDYIGAMTWGSNGLYALYSQGWWGGSQAMQAKVVKLIDTAGNADLKVIDLGSDSTVTPSSIKILGDYIYYRYDVLDAGQATGFHQLARKNFVTGTADEELTKSLPGLPSGLEILTYDVSDDNNILYFVAYQQAENKVIGGRIDLAANTWSLLDTAKKLNSIRIIK